MIKVNSGTTAGSVLISDIPPKRAKQEGAVETLSSSQVTLSNALTEATAYQAEDSTVFNKSRVDELRAAIASGQFSIDSSAIADSLLQTASDLLSQAQQGYVA